MTLRLLKTLIAILALAPVPLLAEQTATVLHDTELRSEPFSDARVTGTLRAKSTLTVLKRQGGWYQARHAGQQGWVRMSAIRMGEIQAGGSTGIGEALGFLGSGRSGASGVTVATGIRGLDAADVANATPDHNALKKLGRFQVTAAQARDFATAAQLKSRQLAYLSAQEKQPDSAIPGLGEDW